MEIAKQKRKSGIMAMAMVEDSLLREDRISSPPPPPPPQMPFDIPVVDAHIQGVEGGARPSQFPKGIPVRAGTERSIKMQKAGQGHRIKPRSNLTAKQQRRRDAERAKARLHPQDTMLERKVVPKATGKARHDDTYLSTQDLASKFLELQTNVEDFMSISSRPSQIPVLRRHAQINLASTQSLPRNNAFDILHPDVAASTDKKEISVKHDAAFSTSMDVARRRQEATKDLKNEKIALAAQAIQLEEKEQELQEEMAKKEKKMDMMVAQYRGEAEKAKSEIYNLNVQLENAKQVKVDPPREYKRIYARSSSEKGRPAAAAKEDSKEDGKEDGDTDDEERQHLFHAMEDKDRKIAEQEHLLDGYQRENEKLVERVHATQKDHDAEKILLYREKEKMSAELNMLRNRLVSLGGTAVERASLLDSHADVGSRIREELALDLKARELEEENAHLIAKSKGLLNAEKELKFTVEQLRVEKHQLQSALQKQEGNHNDVERREVASLEKKIADMNAQYTEEVSGLKSKLLWYAENQDIIDGNDLLIKQQKEEIGDLKAKMAEENRSQKRPSGSRWANMCTFIHIFIYILYIYCIYTVYIYVYILYIYMYICIFIYICEICIYT
jgi:hypothetical protein